MATARCEERERPIGRIHQFAGPFFPVGHPNRSLICGYGKCEHVAMAIWLNENEEESYQQGKRIFALNTYTGAKIAVK